MRSFRFEIGPEYDGRRLDQVLAALLPGESRSSIVRLIEEGNVSIDQERSPKKSLAVAAGARLEVSIPDPVTLALTPRDLPLSVLYEDDAIVVIDKPAGLVVHPGAGHEDSTLVHALLHHIKDLSGVGGELRPGIVHRLDQDTTGVLVVAKSDTAHRALTSQWNTDAVEKEYVAVVYGTPKMPSGTIEKPIDRDPRDRKKMAVIKGGRTAITNYRVVESLRHASVVHCWLRTGRTHQIRVHLKSLGHPIVGDPLYSGPQWRGVPDKRMQRTFSEFSRQALHARRLRIPHPLSGESMIFEAPMPADMTALIEALRTGNAASGDAG
jgi:23S rRNA pseudouridine1911/1915/1917 synthase